MRYIGRSGKMDACDAWRNLTGFTVGAGLGLVGMLALQPEQGTTKGGFSTLLKTGENRCLHVHHWLLCVGAAIVVASAVTCSGGAWNVPLFSLQGALLGMAASDLAYTDLSLTRFCVVCEAPNVPDACRGCVQVCKGT